jgi:hypothetical protein
MFAAVVERLRSGESYYEAMGAELQRRDYPTHVVFNWRTPLHLTMVALAPWAVWRGVLTGLLVAVFVATMLVARDLITKRSAGLLLVGVLVLFAAQDAVFVSEAWAGPLLALSACAFALGSAGIGIGCALAALFIRELAAPYCVIGTLLALRNRQWAQVTGWLTGAAAYALYFGWHVAQVLAHRPPTDVSDQAAWLTFPGLPFLQATMLKLGWFAFGPPALGALAVALVTAGSLARATPIHLRATAIAYCVFFLIAGFPFNDYWGFLVAPTWAIVGGYGVAAVAEAVRTVRSPVLASSTGASG